MPSISYRVRVVDPQLHAVEVEATVTADPPLPKLCFYMPVWAPGSYLVREFARHVESFSATVDGAPARAAKIRKNAWQIEHDGARTVTVRYRLWANEMTVRTNHLDATHAFLSGPATFMTIEGLEGSACEVVIEAPSGWRITTALRAVGPARFAASCFDELADAPFEIGVHDEERFEVLERHHTLAVWPAAATTTEERAKLVRDASAILEAHARLFGGELPYDAYAILVHMMARGRGGLEHASSTALHVSMASFASREAYLDMLALLSHETFHAWNVKRIRPAALTPYRYQAESYTRLLWWFEGATSYYDWQALRRAKLCSKLEYVDHLAGEIAYLDTAPGRLVQSLEDASFDAWIKAYRPDANTTNSCVSYYRKGEIVCALLDLEIRARSNDNATLDHAVAALWAEHGKTGVPVEERGLEPLIARACGVKLDDLFERWLRRTEEIDYDASLAHAGLSVERSTRGGSHASLGVRVRVEGARSIVSGVPRGGPAHRAGIDVGDELIAVRGRRVEGAAIDAVLAGTKAGDEVLVVITREGRVHTRKVVLDKPRADRGQLVPRADASPEARARFKAWLGGAHPAWETK